MLQPEVGKPASRIAATGMQSVDYMPTLVKLRRALHSPDRLRPCVLASARCFPGVLVIEFVAEYRRLLLEIDGGVAEHAIQ